MILGYLRSRRRRTPKIKSPSRYWIPTGAEGAFAIDEVADWPPHVILFGLNVQRKSTSDRSVVPAQVPSDDESQLVLGNRQGRQAVVAVVTPHKPDERSVWRRPSGVVINAAV